MSKKHTKTALSYHKTADTLSNYGIEIHDGIIVTDTNIGAMIGSIMSIIEIAGFSEKQEEALKSQIRQQINRLTHNSVIIDSHQHAKLWLEQNNRDGDIKDYGFEDTGFRHSVITLKN